MKTSNYILAVNKYGGSFPFNNNFYPKLFRPSCLYEGLSLFGKRHSEKILIQRGDIYGN